MIRKFGEDTENHEMVLTSRPEGGVGQGQDSSMSLTGSCQEDRLPPSARPSRTVSSKCGTSCRFHRFRNHSREAGTPSGQGRKVWGLSVASCEQWLSRNLGKQGLDRAK